MFGENGEFRTVVRVVATPIIRVKIDRAPNILPGYVWYSNLTITILIIDPSFYLFIYF